MSLSLNMRESIEQVLKEEVRAGNVKASAVPIIRDKIQYVVARGLDAEGVYAMGAYSVIKRLKEAGVRKVARWDVERDY